MSNLNYISGMASGLDTQSMITSLMKAERVPLDKIQAKKTIAEWKQSDYRDIINSFRTFKDELMNVAKPASNITSASYYKKFSSAITDNVTGDTSNIVSVTTNSDAAVGAHTIRVDRLATAANTQSAGRVTDDVQGTAAIADTNLSGKKLNITLDGITREITLDNYATVDDLATGLEGLITNSFGKGFDGVNGKIDVINNGGVIKLVTQNGANKLSITDGTTNNALGSLNITSGTTNRLSLSATLDSLKTNFATDLSFTADKLNFNINGKNFEFAKTTTISNMMSTINGDATANVHIEYSETNDTFKITSNQYGAGKNINISETGGNLFSGASKIAVGTYENGLDAKVELDGQTLIRSENSFTVNGVNYKLLNTSANTQNVKLDIDVDGVYNNIKTFVDKYNEFITKINDKVSEEYDKDYQPLTSDQKDSMSDSEVELWEKKAKTGLLHNDSMLSKSVNDIRKAVSNYTTGLSQNLFAMGITTGSYTEKGKLVIDETKLKKAISTDIETLTNIFTKKSTTYPTYSRSAGSLQKETRLQEEGVANRLYDIFENNISTYRDSGGKKGLLIEKAGLKGDASEYSNTIYTELVGYKKSIVSWEDRLEAKEAAYVKKYAALETAMNKLNSQSNWLASQLK